MPKPITNAVAQLIVQETLASLEKRLAEVDAEHELLKAKAGNRLEDHYRLQSDHRFHRSVYVELAFRQVVGALGGLDAENAAKRILGAADDCCFGVDTRSCAELTVDSARRRARFQKSQHQGVSA